MTTNIGLARSYGRTPAQKRPTTITRHYLEQAPGSCLIQTGGTKVLCAVTIEEDVPRWMKNQRVSGGWLTAEYAMLPYSTLDRKKRDSSAGKVDTSSL